jgi:membrane fusion protein (multidrug efflux system)
MQQIRIAFLAAMATSVGLAACGGEESVATEGSAEAPVVHLMQIEAVTLETTSFSDERSLVGETDPIRSAYVASEMPGRLVELTGALGETVTAGDVLVRVDASSPQSQIDQIRVQIAGVETEIERNERLIERGLGTEATLDQLRNQRDVLNESISAIRTTVRAATTRAPITGIVTDRMAEPGELLRIVDISTIVVAVGVPEGEIGRVDVGQTVTVAIPAMGMVTEGTIHRIAPEANRANRTFRTEVHVANEDGRLRAGLRATVTIPRANIPNAIVIPADAVIQGLNGPEVAIVENNITTIRPIVTGPRRGSYIVATEGLVVGERLVVRGQRNVVNGEHVGVTDLGACCSAQLAAYLQPAAAAANE